MNRSKWIAIVLFITAVFITAVVPLAAGAARDPVPLPVWRAADVASGREIGLRNALAIDSLGQIHILYSDPGAERLLYGRADGQNWQTEIVANVPTTDLDLALNTQEQPFIALLDRARNELFAGPRLGDTWQLDRLDDTAQTVELALDPNGRAHILLAAEREVIYWRQEGQEWVREVVAGPGTVVYNAQLTLDSDGRPWAAYARYQHAALAHRDTSGQWSEAALPFEYIVDLTLDAHDNPLLLVMRELVTMVGRYPFITEELSFAESTAAGWQETWLGEQDWWGGAPRILAGSDGTVHLALNSWYGSNYMRREPGAAWQFEFPSPSFAGDIGLALGPDQRPWILSHNPDSLILSRRDVLLLDQFALLPVIGSS